MRLRFGLGVVVMTSMAVAMIAPAATAMQAQGRAVSPTLSQSYTCQTPIGPESATIKVTGKAKIKGSKITLKKVVYSVQNNFGVDITVDQLKVSVPDPGSSLATYVNGSAKVAKKPKGYKAGHDSDGIFASHAGDLAINNGDTVKTAALGAKYTVTGSQGDEVDFQPGDVGFELEQPVSGAISCTPDSPVGTFASVTE